MLFTAYFAHTVKVNFGNFQWQFASSPFHHILLCYWSNVLYWKWMKNERKSFFKNVFFCFFRKEVWIAVEIIKHTHFTHNEIHKSALLARIRWRIPTCSMCSIFSRFNRFIYFHCLTEPTIWHTKQMKKKLSNIR